MSEGGLFTLGETMGLVVQGQPGGLRNGEPMTFAMGGAESNVAIGVRRLGVPATWLGRVGSDPPGELIVRELRAEQVEALAIRDSAPTGLMVRWRPMAGRGRVVYYRRASAGAQLSADDVPLERVRAAAVLHVTGITPALGSGPREAVRAAVAAAREAGVRVSVDVNYRAALWPAGAAAPVLAELVAGADVVFAGLEEACLVAGVEPGRQGAARSAADALAGLGPADVVIKLGAAGCAARVDGRSYELPARAVDVVDTVGAGDAFVAGFLAELISGADTERCLATALAAGAFAVTVPGDWEGAPRREDLGLLEHTEPVIR